LQQKKKFICTIFKSPKWVITMWEIYGWNIGRQIKAKNERTSRHWNKECQNNEWQKEERKQSLKIMNDRKKKATKSWKMHCQGPKKMWRGMKMKRKCCALQVQ
jgi:hypothetical protein